MEDDFLSKRNIYKIDDEDAGLALEGYSMSVMYVCVLIWLFASSLKKVLIEFVDSLIRKMVAFLVIHVHFCIFIMVRSYVCLYVQS